MLDVLCIMCLAREDFFFVHRIVVYHSNIVKTGTKTTFEHPLFYYSLCEYVCAVKGSHWTRRQCDCYISPAEAEQP